MKTCATSNTCSVRSVRVQYFFATMCFSARCLFVHRFLHHVIRFSKRTRCRVAAEREKATAKAKSGPRRPIIKAENKDRREAQSVSILEAVAILLLKSLKRGKYTCDMRVKTNHHSQYFVELSHLILRVVNASKNCKKARQIDRPFKTSQCSASQTEERR